MGSGCVWKELGMGSLFGGVLGLVVCARSGYDHCPIISFLRARMLGVEVL